MTFYFKGHVPVKHSSLLLITLSALLLTQPLSGQAQSQGFGSDLPATGLTPSLFPPASPSPSGSFGSPAPQNVSGFSSVAAAAADNEAETAADKPNTVKITYQEEVQLDRQVLTPDGYKNFATPMRINKTVELDLDAADLDFEELDLPPDGKRIAVLTITARRHAKLLEDYRTADTEEEKSEAMAALKENYTEHYRIETWWRTQKLDALEAELAKMKAQVQQRVDSQDKYVEAAMTIASLHVDGISIAPPVPAVPQGAQPVSEGPYYSDAFSPTPYSPNARGTGNSGQSNSFPRPLPVNNADRRPALPPKSPLPSSAGNR